LAGSACESGRQKFESLLQADGCRIIIAKKRITEPVGQDHDSEATLSLPAVQRDLSASTSYAALFQAGEFLSVPIDPVTENLPEHSYYHLRSQFGRPACGWQHAQLESVNNNRPNKAQCDKNATCTIIDPFIVGNCSECTSVGGHNGGHGSKVFL
jgi:hypothetical protein